MSSFLSNKPKVISPGNAPNSTSSTRSYVQTNSVQTQFSVLTHDRETFEKEQRSAEEEHRRVVERVRRLKAEHADYIAKGRTEQEGLGNLTRKYSMLEQERNRLSRVIENERKALEECAMHIKSLVQKESSHKKVYCHEMDALNEETAQLLQRQSDEKLKSFLSVEAIEAVLVPKLPREDQDGFRKDFEEALALLKEATAQVHRERELLDTRTNNLLQVQASRIPEVGMDADGDSSMTEPKNIELFYDTRMDDAVET